MEEMPASIYQTHKMLTVPFYWNFMTYVTKVWFILHQKCCFLIPHSSQEIQPSLKDSAESVKVDNKRGWFPCSEIVPDLSENVFEMPNFVFLKGAQIPCLSSWSTINLS